MFIKYTKVVANCYEEIVKYWLTFNEIDSIVRRPYTSDALVEDCLHGQNFMYVICQAMHH